MEPVINGKDPMTEKEINEALNKLDTLYFDEYSHNKNIKFYDFVEKFFVLNNTHYTFNKRTDTFFIGTNHHRSLVDIYRTCKSYYKGTNIRKIVKAILKIHEKNLLSSHICNDINRRVYKHIKLSQGWHSGGVAEKDLKDEFGLSWQNLIKISEKKQSITIKPRKR